MFKLEEVKEAILGHTEFVSTVHNGRISFDYIVIIPSSFRVTEEEVRFRAYLLWEKAGCPVTDSDFFWEQAKRDVKRFIEIRRNCRGIVFDEKTGEIISLPLHKFFNVNQIEETQYHLISEQDAVIYEKLDGSMIHFFVHNGVLEASTARSSTNSYSLEALSLANKFGITNLILDTINQGFTPVFEFVAPKNQIVVRYEQPRLVYLVSRNRSTGEYLVEGKFPDKAKSYSFKFSDVFNNLNTTEFEGYVCHLANKMIVKVKTPWYMERHHAVDMLMRPAYKLYQLAFDGFMDDLIAFTTETFHSALQAIEDEAYRDLLNAKLRIEERFNELLPIYKKLKEVPEENFDKFSDLKNQVKILKEQGKKLDAIKLVRDFTKLGLQESKNFVESGVFPHGFIAVDDQENERVKIVRDRRLFYNLVQEKYPEDLDLLMSFYGGVDIKNQVIEKLMEGYKLKYTDKLYAGFEIDSVVDVGQQLTECKWLNLKLQAANSRL